MRHLLELCGLAHKTLSSFLLSMSISEDVALFTQTPLLPWPSLTTFSHLEPVSLVGVFEL